MNNQCDLCKHNDETWDLCELIKEESYAVGLPEWKIEFIIEVYQREHNISRIDFACEECFIKMTE